MGTVRGGGSVDDETPTGRRILHRLRDPSLTRAEQQGALDEACTWLRASGGTGGRSTAGYGDVLQTILTGVRVSAADGGFQGLVVDLSGLHIEDLDLAGLLFESGELRLEDCAFSRSCSFVGAELAGGVVSFAGSTFAGRGRSSAARFDGVAVTGAEVRFDRANFVGGTPPDSDRCGARRGR